MSRYIAGRVAGGLVTILIASMLAFVVFQSLPGDPAAVMAGPGASPAQIEAIRADFGLNDPVMTEFVDWWKNAVQLDLGVSVYSNVPVRDLIAERLPVTLELIGTSLVVALLMTFVLSLGAFRPGSMFDRFGIGWCVVGLSLPVFWVGILLVLLFSVRLNLLPASGFVSFFDSPTRALRSSLLASVTFGFYMSAILIQFLRRSVIDVNAEDYVRTARAKGLSSSSILVGHIAKPALAPFVTVLGILIGTAVGWTMLVEAVFDYPGFGRLFIDSIQKRDYFVVQSGIVLVIAAVVVVNIVVDVVYAALDPRIRLGE